MERRLICDGLVTDKVEWMDSGCPWQQCQLSPAFGIRSRYKIQDTEIDFRKRDRHGMTTPPTMTRWTATALFFLILSTACAFQRPRPLILNHGLLHASATVAAPGETVEEVFANVRDLISSELGLGNYEQTPLTMQGVRGSVETWDSNMDANVAWLSSLTMSGEGEGHFFASLQAFVGPKTDVPHFVARCRSLQKTTTESSSPRVALYLDFSLSRRSLHAPRLEDGSGDYAPPDSREGFAAAGAAAMWRSFHGRRRGRAAAVTTGADAAPALPRAKGLCVHHRCCYCCGSFLPSMFHDSNCSPSSRSQPLSLSAFLVQTWRSRTTARAPVSSGPLAGFQPDTAAGRQACAEAAAAAARRWIGWMATKNAEGIKPRRRGRLAHEPHDLRARLPSTQPDCRRRSPFSAFLSTVGVVVVVVVTTWVAVHSPSRPRRSSWPSEAGPLDRSGTIPWLAETRGFIYLVWGFLRCPA